MRAALALVFAASLGGCFLVPSPDDAWSDDYGRAATDAQAPDASDATRTGCAASATACVSCCDTDPGTAAGTAFFVVLFKCVCPDDCASVCGGDCANPPQPSAQCAQCLTVAARANASCWAPQCGAGAACHDYATCIGGCEP